MPLGAGQEIGRSCLLLQMAGLNIMFDCGVHMAQTGPERFPDWARIAAFAGASTGDEPVQPTEAVRCLDAVLVSHCHLDHVAALPVLTEQLGYTGPVVMTPPTAALAPHLVVDYHSMVRGKRRRAGSGTPASPPGSLSAEAVKACFAKAQHVRVGEPLNLHFPATDSRPARDLTVTAFHAGHVLGAVMLLAQCAGHSALYTGDFNCTPEWHLPALALPADLAPDIMISESTLGVTSRHATGKQDTDMLQVVRASLARGGRVLVPVHAVGRAQEILLQVAADLREATAPPASLLLVQGLAVTALEQYAAFADWCSPEVRSLLPAGAKEWTSLATIVSLQEALEAPGPSVIFAGPGSLGGGASQALLRSILPDPASLVVLPSFCMPGTVGQRLSAGQRRITLAGKAETVQCAVHSMSYSAHVDGAGILHTIQAAAPRAVLLVHGEPGKMAVLHTILAKHMNIPSAMPENFEVLDLAFDPKPQKCK